jgi:DNA-binding NarL/FixJ family response regulator
MIRVLIIAPDPLARAGLTALLSSQPTVTVVGQLAPDHELATHVQPYQPEALLWDMGWNPQAYLDLLNDLVELSIPVVALVENEATVAVWTAGVRGLLLRTTPATALAAALVAVAEGLLVVEPALATLLSAADDGGAGQPLTEALTPREHEVLTGLAEGLSNKQIARQLAISEHTVKFHVNAILGKLGAQSRTEAVVRATRAGLILL